MFLLIYAHLYDESAIPLKVTGWENGPELPADVRVVFFRIAQEAVTNTEQYSHNDT